MIQIHQLKPKTKIKRKKRVGRGGKRGTYCGRGVKGQKSRAGAKLKPIIREILKKYPKLRGYRFSPKREKFVPVNLDLISKKFKEGEKVSFETLVEKKLIRKNEKPKILGRGELTKSLIFENLPMSKTAREKIEKAKGKIL
jgi:large subunit ribosomal protein L15